MSFQGSPYYNSVKHVQKFMIEDLDCMLLYHFSYYHASKDERIYEFDPSLMEDGWLDY